MLNFINNKSSGSQWVVQKYIERPLLYHNRKFDIRVWALVTSKNEIYFYRQGYLRTSGVEYNCDESDVTIHLTNQCLQLKDKQTYGKHEEGNMVNFTQFQTYLDSTFPGKVSVANDIVPRMKDLVIDCFSSVKYSVNPNRRKNHFELFGFDFMIDEDFRTWLIEVNTNPYLGKPNQWSKEIIPAMIDEMFRIVLDPIYPPRDQYYNSQSFYNRKHNFELIYSEGSVSNLDYVDRGKEAVTIN